MDWTKASIVIAGVAAEGVEDLRMLFARWGNEGQWLHVGSTTVIDGALLVDPEVVLS